MSGRDSRWWRLDYQHRVLGACVHIVRKHGAEHPPTVLTIARLVFRIPAEQAVSRKQLRTTLIACKKLRSAGFLDRRKESDVEQQRRVLIGADAFPDKQWLYWPVLGKLMVTAPEPPVCNQEAA